MTRHRDLEADLHPSVITARHLRATADTWPDLLAALAKEGTPAAGAGKRTKRDAAPMPINAYVSDVMREIGSWAHFWSRVLMDETDWTPPTDGLLTVPRLLTAMAQRTGHFTEHPDRTLAAAFITETEETRRKAETTAHPTGHRKIPVHRPCEVHGCTGELYAPLKPDLDYLPDLVCSEDRKHRVEPVEWSRPRWRHRDDGRITA